VVGLSLPVAPRRRSVKKEETLPGEAGPLAVVILLVFLVLVQCRGAAEGGDMASYEAALARTAPEHMAGLLQGSAAEKEAIQRFRTFVAEMKADEIGAQALEVYAAEAYFNDTLKEIEGAQNIATYLAESLEAVHEARVEVRDVAQTQGNYYFIWK
jgi:hypothetical protein